MGKEQNIEDNEGRKKKALRNIKSNYQKIEQSIVQQLYMRQDLHKYSAGAAREDIWEQLFKMILPKKFVIEHSVFIIDTDNGISHEVDLAVMDETYTPFIFSFGRLKFIPIEAVAAVIECKSGTIDEGIARWVDSIKGLKTHDESIARMAGSIAFGGVTMQKATRPLRILCALKENIKENVQGLFDFVLSAVDDKEGEPAHIEVAISQDFNSLLDWFGELNFYGKTDEKEKAYSNLDGSHKEKLEDIKLTSYEVKGKDGRVQSLMTFNFQLNQLLMLINNPLLFPHREYAKMFNEEKEG